MLHRGTLIVTTLLIALAVSAFVIDPLINDAPVTQKAAVGESEAQPQVQPVASGTGNNGVAEKTLPVFTSEMLARYNGTDASLPIYIAFEGNVYDVTAGKEYYQPGGAYDFLAGTDGTSLLILVGGDIIKKKYPVIGTYTEK